MKWLPSTGSTDWRPEASGSPSRMRTARTPVTVSSPRNASGAASQTNSHALLLGVLHLAHRARHVGAVAAIQAVTDAAPWRTAVRTQSIAVSPPPTTTTCLPRGVQRAGRELRHRVAQALAVGGGQVVQRRHDARQPDARAADVARLVDAGGDQHRVVPRAQLGEGSVAADLAAEVEVDAALLQQLAGGAARSPSPA